MEQRVKALDESREIAKVLANEKEEKTKKIMKLEKKVERVKETLVDLKTAHDQNVSMSEHLTVKLRISEEKRAYLEGVTKKAEITFELKQEKWTEEKEQLQSQLEKARQDLEDFDGNVNGICSENTELKIQIAQSKNKLEETENELSILKE